MMSGRQRSDRWLYLGWAAALVLAAGWIYWPALHGAWVWDDLPEVARNPDLRDRAGLFRIWFHPGGPDFFPLKSTVQWLEWRLWGDQTLGYHLLNVALQLLSALLIGQVLRRLIRLSGRMKDSAAAMAAGLAATLWIVHPLLVESVAWIAELKNTLSLPPLLLSFLAYLDFNERGRKTDYLRSWLWFGAALLCKTSVVMYPFFLLVFSWWREGKVSRRDCRRSSAFLAAALALGLATIWFQRHRAMAGLDFTPGGWAPRFAAGGCAVLFYLEKFVWPVGLLPIYPRWNLEPPAAAQSLPWLAILASFVWFWLRRRTWGRHALLGFGAYLLNLIPVLGFIPMAFTRLSWVADHFAYLSFVPLVMMSSAAAVLFWTKASSPLRWMGIFLGGALAATGAVLSHRQAAIFQSEESLWTWTVQHNPAAWLAQSNLGNALLESGRAAEAIPRLQAALVANPQYPEAHNNLGRAWAVSGRKADAANEFAAAVRLAPRYFEAQRNLGSALLELNRPAEAADAYRAALALEPADRDTRAGLGIADYRQATDLANAGRLPAAIDLYRQSVAVKADSPEAQANLGLALAMTNDLSAAVEHLKIAIQLRPAYAEAHAYLGFAFEQAHQLPEAAAEYGAALRINPRDADTRYHYQAVLHALGRAP